MIKADFLITGEVVGQRPFSQVSSKMKLVERETNLAGKLLRPLSAKLLTPTEPELNGLVDRERLEGISGRSRKRQMQLAEQFGLEDYPSPASGCLLTDAGYSNRLRDLLAHVERVSFEDLNLLRVGRHFRLDRDTKVVVGRNEDENRQIASLRRDHHTLVEAPDVGSPLTLLIGPSTEANIEKAAMITARYSSGRKQPLVRVVADYRNKRTELMVTPAREVDLTPVAVR